MISGATSDGPVTALLRQFVAGDKNAFDQLVPLIYSELQRLASGLLRNERRNHTLQPTALVHEAYSRLIKQDQQGYNSRAHFLAVASHVMRQILIDHARSRKAAKRDLDLVDSLWGDPCLPVSQPSVLIAIDDALRTLEEKNPFEARLIEMRFFGGMTAEESAEILHIPVQQVRRKLRVTQAWLKRELEALDPSAPLGQ